MFDISSRLVVVSGPAGVGKDTVVAKLLEKDESFSLSVSATTRAPRGEEKHGVNYYYFSTEEFLAKVENDEFIEHAQYGVNRYGTLKSEMQRIWAKGNIIIFDVDVMGGISLKRIFGENACSIFIQAPSVEALRERLIGRGTDSMETIEKRVAKAEFELSKAPEFDHIVVNDDLATAVENTKLIINSFLAQ